MKITKNFGLNMPDEDDFVEIDKINENAEKIDEELDKKADASGGDISETVITTVKASQAEYPVPAAGDSAKTVLGKVQKFFADIRNWMKGVCLLGQIVNNCVTDNAKLPLSAAQGKVLMDLYNVLNTNQQKIINSGANIGGGMCVYTIRQTGKMLTRELQYPDSNGNHSFGFLILDQNGYTDIYAIGLRSSVKSILKTSALTAPYFSGPKLMLPLSGWGWAFLITNEREVTIK